MKPAWTTLSVFFPVYNEASALPGVLERAVSVLGGMGLDEYEVIIVDDGSTDDTGRLADEAAVANPKLRVVHHERNLGYGAALVSGFEAARFEWTAYTDGDGQFDIGNLTRFMGPSERAEVVLGYRLRRSDHAGRRFNAWLWGRLVRLIVRLEVRDLDCGFKLVRTERLKSLAPLQARGAVISAELLLRLQAAGCRWEEVGVDHYPRVGGAPSGAKLRVIVRAVRELMALRRVSAKW